MVINSLLLILVDTLPLFVLLAYLAYLQVLTLQRLLSALIVVLCLTGGVLYFSASINNWWDGTGMEVMRVVINLLCFPAIVLVIMTKSPWQHPCVVVSLSSVAIPNSINYIIYFSGLWQSQSIDASFFIGMAMGMGISLSVSVLLFLILDSVKNTLLPLVLLCTFIAGQIANAASVFEQINWLEDPIRLWNSNALLAEHNEYGQLLHILIGYEATPTQYYLGFYLLSLLFLGILLWRTRRQQVNSGVVV